MKKLFFIFSLVTFIFISGVYPAYACDAPSGVCVNTNTSVGISPASLNELSPLINNVINILYILVEATFFIMLLVQGYKYMISQGDPKKIAEVKHNLTYAAIGFVLVFLGYLIVVLIGKVVPFNSGNGYNLLNNGNVQLNVNGS